MPTNRIGHLIPAPASAPEYVGWLRSDGNDWEPVCSSGSSLGVWALLLAMDAAGKNVERAVLPSGRHPGKPAPKARR